MSDSISSDLAPEPVGLIPTQEELVTCYSYQASVREKKEVKKSPKVSRNSVAVFFKT